MYWPSSLQVLRTLHLEGEITPSTQDCTACRLTGFITLTGLAGYSFLEAHRSGYFSRQARLSSSVRVRGISLVLFGIASGAAGVYRLVL